MAEAIVHLSAIVGSPLLDSSGERLGTVKDVVAAIDADAGPPQVIGLQARIGGRELFVPIDRVERLEADAARTSTTKLNLAQFERRPGEVLLAADLLGHSLINVETARLVKAQEVDLFCDAGTWRVAGIDPTFKARMRRLLPRKSRTHDEQHDQFVPWEKMEPFVGHVPTSRLKLASRRLTRLHPAQIADLVEAASHDEGEEILQAVGQDKELEADVFEELDDEHQVEFLRDRPDQEVAAILGRMAPDDAADLLLELDQDRRLPILGLMPPGKQRTIKNLLGYNPSTAGGIMNPDFVSVRADATVSQVLAAARASGHGSQPIWVVCVLDEDGRLAGAVTLAGLIRAKETDTVRSLIDEAPIPTVSVDEDVPEVARLMSDYNMVGMPVLDADDKPVGIVSVDDILELLIPEEWRRRAGAARE